MTIILLTMGYLLLRFLIVMILCYLSFQSLVEAKIGGFTVEIVHRDSQLSPFYNQSATPGDLSRNDAVRSMARGNYFHRPSSIDGKKIESVVIPNGADYLMKLSIGSPPVEVLAIADTGSDLVWIQCEPCPQSQCYPQDQPYFNPMKSSTYMELPCDSQPCQYLQSGCGNTKNECQYSYGYGDGSQTNGVLATETFTFDSTDGQVAAFPNSVFGCGHNNRGIFTRRGSGLVGLGGGPLSLISQLGSQIEQKFSYCLLPRTVNSASKLKFGSDAVLSGPGVVSTPFLSDNSATFYYLTLEGISVRDKKISPMASNKGNIVIDSGTTLNLLESSLYNDLEAAVKEAIALNPVQDPQGIYQLCYDRSSFSSSTVPAEMTMVFHFTGGADVTLKPLNIFRMFDSVACLAMLPSGSSVYGNWAQMNFQVEYDLGRKQVSFAPADCTQY